MFLQKEINPPHNMVEQIMFLFAYLMFHNTYYVLPQYPLSPVYLYDWLENIAFIWANMYEKKVFFCLHLRCKNTKSITVEGCVHIGNLKFVALMYKSNRNQGK